MEQLEFSEDHFLQDKSWIALFEEDPGLLIDYLERAYRDDLWVELPLLVDRMEELSRDITLKYPQLEEMLLHLKLVNTSLLRHMLLEEAFLFAALRKKGKKRRKSGKEEKKALRQLIGLLENEHIIVKEGFSRIKALCDNYQTPLDDAVLPSLYASLEKCEQLVRKQIYLESHILFEKIILKDPPGSG